MPRKKLSPPPPEATAKAKASRLKRLRKFTTLERRDLFEKYGINASTLKGWENSRANGLSAKGAKKVLEIAKAEGVIATYEWLMFGKGEGPYIINSIPKTQNDDATKLAELEYLRNHYVEILDLIVPDHGMEPWYHFNDHVAGPKYMGEQIERCVDLPCIIQMESGICLLRKLKRNVQDYTYSLLCINPDATESVLSQVKIIAAAPVIWHRRKTD